MRQKKSFLLVCAVSVLACLSLGSSMIPMAVAKPRDDMRDAVDQSNKASKVFNEIMDAPDKGISRDLLDRVECVAVFPSVIKAAFIFGGKGGKGLVSCRNRETREWGAPVFLKIGGGSFGFQIGAEATDLILLGMNSSTIDTFRKNRFEWAVKPTPRQALSDAAQAPAPICRRFARSSSVILAAVERSQVLL